MVFEIFNAQLWLLLENIKSYSGSGLESKFIMAAPVKKLKLDGGRDAGQFHSVIVYILPTKIQKKRLEVIYNCARSLNMTVLEKFRYENDKYLSDNRFRDSFIVKD